MAEQGGADGGGSVDAGPDDGEPDAGWPDETESANGDTDPVPFGGADRPELAATTVATLCAIAFMTFATLEVLVLDPGLGRLSAAVALVASTAAGLAGGLTLRSSLTGRVVLHGRALRDGIAATLTGATVLLVVTPPSWSSLPFLSAVGLSLVGIGLLASAVPAVRRRLGFARPE